MIININHIRSSMLNAIDEIQTTVDNLLDSALNDEFIIGILETEFDQTSFNQHFTFARSMAIVKGIDGKDVSKLDIFETYDKYISASIIPYEFRNSAKYELTSLSDFDISMMTDEYKIDYYIIEKHMSKLLFACDLACLLSIEDDLNFAEYHTTQASLFNSMDVSLLAIMKELFCKLMHNALLSKDDTIRDRFITFEGFLK